MLHEYRIPYSCGFINKYPGLRSETISFQSRDGSQRDIIAGPVKAQSSIDSAGYPYRITIQDSIVSAGAVHSNVARAVIELPVCDQTVCGPR